MRITNFLSEEERHIIEPVMTFGDLACSVASEAKQSVQFTGGGSVTVHNAHYTAMQATHAIAILTK